MAARPELNCPGFLAGVSTLRIHRCIYFCFFNVVNGQLNELQFVIFMVNLKSSSCGLILLVGGKTRTDSCCTGTNSNRHFMLNYGHRPEQKAQPDFQAQRPRRGRAACGDTANRLRVPGLHASQPQPPDRL